MKKRIIQAVLLAFVAGIVYAGVAGHLSNLRIRYYLATGDKRMVKRDFLAAVGCYEKIMGIDSASVTAHLRLAVSLDSLGRPMEMDWHYNDAEKYSGRQYHWRDAQNGRVFATNGIRHSVLLKRK